MAEQHATLEEAIAIARRLSPTERLKLRQELDQMTGTAGQGEYRTKSTEADFRRRLLETGLISEVRLGQQLTDPDKYVPVRVEGEPVSQTIIEDRG